MEIDLPEMLSGLIEYFFSGVSSSKAMSVSFVFSPE